MIGKMAQILFCRLRSGNFDVNQLRKKVYEVTTKVNQDRNITWITMISQVKDTTPTNYKPLEDSWLQEGTWSLDTRRTDVKEFTGSYFYLEIWRNCTIFTAIDQALWKVYHIRQQLDDTRMEHFNESTVYLGSSVIWSSSASGSAWII